jgi:hypothetical protein
MIIPELYETFISKMREMEITSLSDSEIDRVFHNCVSPIICIKKTKELINNGLSMADIYPKLNQSTTFKGGKMSEELKILDKYFHEMALAQRTERVFQVEDCIRNLVSCLIVRAEKAESEAKETKEKFEGSSFWKDWVFPEGAKPEEIQNELIDYHTYLEETAKVYCHITNGAISKQNTKAEEIISIYDDEVSSLVDRAEKAEDRVRELEEAQRWIPVSEKLPEVMTDVLVLIPPRRSIVCYLDLDENYQSIERLMTIVGPVTHWHPLLPTPEEVE